MSVVVATFTTVPELTANAVLEDTEVVAPGKVQLALGGVKILDLPSEVFVAEEV